jgi:hypothetical protein
MMTEADSPDAPAVVMVGAYGAIPVEISQEMRLAARLYHGAADLRSFRRTQGQLEAAHLARRAVVCPEPFCRALPGERCLTKAGRRKNVAHERRARRADDALRQLLLGLLPSL